MTNKEFKIDEIVHYITELGFDTGVIKGFENDKYKIKNTFNQIIEIEKENVFETAIEILERKIKSK